jgi:hypothetical protein
LLSVFLILFTSSSLALADALTSISNSLFPWSFLPAGSMVPFSPPS